MRVLIWPAWPACIALMGSVHFSEHEIYLAACAACSISARNCSSTRHGYSMAHAAPFPSLAAACSRNTCSSRGGSRRSGGRSAWLCTSRCPTAKPASAAPPNTQQMQATAATTQGRSHLSARSAPAQHPPAPGGASPLPGLLEGLGCRRLACTGCGSSGQLICSRGSSRSRSGGGSGAGHGYWVGVLAGCRLGHKSRLFERAGG